MITTNDMPPQNTPSIFPIIYPQPQKPNPSSSSPSSISMAASVQIKQASFIKPADPTPFHVLPLSALDSQLFLRFTVEYLFAFKPPPPAAAQNVDTDTIVDRIKFALSKILVPYYPLAGRVRPRSRPDDSSGLEVVCRAQGGLFVEAVSDSFETAEFERAPKCVRQWRKLLSFQVPDVLKGAPPLVVQLTWLKDGGATLAVGFNHCLIDGIGGAQFLNSFAELARAAGGGGSDVVKLKLPKPVWDRHLLDPPADDPTRRCYSVSHPEFARVPDLCGFAARFSNDKLLTPTSVTFDRRSQNELKRVAAARLGGGGGDPGFFTSFEVMAAQVWRSWVRALANNILPGNQTVKLLFSINVRDRVGRPGLPAGYYGNAFVMGCAQASAREIGEKGGLGHVAMLVKEAKERVDEEFVNSVVEEVSRENKAPDSVGVLILSQWSRLGMERVDFGMGRPVSVGPVCVDRYCLMLPVRDRTDAVRVTLAVPASGAQRYEVLVNSPCS